MVAGDGSVLATGYSREGSPHDHAEEAALAKLDPADPRLGRGDAVQLAGAVPFPRLPAAPVRGAHHRGGPAPGGNRLAGAARVRARRGAALLRGAGITVVEVPGLAAQARAVNAGVLGGVPGQGPP